MYKNNIGDIDFVKMKNELTEAAKKDIGVFVKLVRPDLYIADIHIQILRMCVTTKNPYMLVLIPRGHLKSVLMTVYAAYCITIQPDITILYCSENKGVLEGQIEGIKKILLSPLYVEYFGHMIAPRKTDRTLNRKLEFTVDHEIRKNNLSVREPTVTGKTIKQANTGAHYDLGIMDDLVTKDNAYTELGRNAIKDFFGAIMAIMSSGSKIVMVGTPYHPRDLYADIETMEVDDEKLFYIYKRVVETDGVFLWPKGKAKDGKYYGFDKKELEIKRVTTKNDMHFYSQYYMNPSALDGTRLGYNNFRYYDDQYIEVAGNEVYYKDKRLNVTAAMDFAFSLRKSADSTVIVVIGQDSDRNIYVLDIIKFKTLKIKDMYKNLLKAFYKWKFKIVRCETVAAQEAVVEQFIDLTKEKKIRNLNIKKYKPNKHDGTKEERIASQLEPTYQELRVFHNKKLKYNNDMESEIVSINAKHDDIKNALADAMIDSKPPFKKVKSKNNINNLLNTNSRFGGYN